MTLRRRTRLLGARSASMAMLCLGLPWCAPGAEKGNLKIAKRGSTVIVTGPSGNFRVVTSGVGNVPRVQWKDRFERLREIAVRVRIRWGHMYDLYSLNEPMLHLRFKTTGVEAQEDGDLAVVVAEGEGEEGNIKIVSRITIDAAREEVEMAMSFNRTLGARQRKFQFQYLVKHTVNDQQDVAWVAPAPGRFAIMRLNDRSDQEIYDQAWHGGFFKTVRVPDNYAVLASVPDRTGVLFSGSNLHHVCWGQRRGRVHCYLYGSDAWLKEGEEHSETFSFRPIDGIAGVSTEKEDCLAGLGALLDRRYVTSGDTVRVHFTCPQQAFSTEAMVQKSGETVLAQTGTGDLELDTSELADGTYTVAKRLRIGDKTLESREELGILRTTYAAVDGQVALVRSFVQGFSADAARDPVAAQIRLGVIDFKLTEIAAYKPLHEVQQIEGLLKDARRAVAALKSNDPAVMPKRGELVWANALSQDTDDLQFFGGGDVQFTPKHGLYFQGVGTINMWTKFAVHGSFMVEFDYCPLDSPKGGTMLQICGQHPIPISQYDFMCTASWGSMAYYMFGVRCYHFSFGVRGRECRLRKTGKGFYVLTHIPDPVVVLDRWYHLAFVKDGNHLMFFTNGTLVQEYFDEGHQGPVLDGGHIGIRNWSTHRAYFRNFRVSTIN